jgi:hypothetical protein
MSPFDPAYKSQLIETTADRRERAAKASARSPGTKSQLGPLAARSPEQWGRD